MAANGQKLRVAVTKTSAQGKSAQSATPNLMSFSTDENSIWFNGKKYGTHLFKNKLYNLNSSSSHADITEALNGATFSDIKDFADRGIQGVVMVDENPDYQLLPVTMHYSEEDDSTVVYFSIIYSNHYITNISIDMTNSSAYEVVEVLSDAFLLESGVVNNLTSTVTSKPLSAAQGKKLQDEKLAKTDVVTSLSDSSTDKALAASMGKLLEEQKLDKASVINNLTSTDTSSALSAAQGKALNDKIDGLGHVYNVKGTKQIIEEVYDISSSAKKGDVWNITNEFTLDGKPYPAGTNVVCIQTWAEQSADPSKNWDALGGTVDLSDYVTDEEFNSLIEIVDSLSNTVVNKDEIINNLNSTSTDKPLSAAQGKKLQDEKLAKTDASNTYLTKTSAESTYAKRADIIPYYSISELTKLSANPTQEELKTALGTPNDFRNAIDITKLILVGGDGNTQSRKVAVCIIDSGNVIVKYPHPGNNDWTVIAKCVPTSSNDNWDNAQFSVRIVKPSDSAGITIE